MAQPWGYQGPPGYGQDFPNYHPESQSQQPPQMHHPQPQMQPYMHPQQQFAGPQHGAQYDPYQQQYPQHQQYPHQDVPQQFGLQFSQQPSPQYFQQPGPPSFPQHGLQFPQQPGPQFTQQPGPQHFPQPGPHHFQQPGPQTFQQPGPQNNQQLQPPFAPQPGYQHDQQYGQLYGSNNSSTYQPQQFHPQASQQSYGRFPKAAAKLARPSPALCFNCGSPEHWAMYCPEPRRAVPAGKLEQSQSQGYGQHSSGFNPQATPNQYSPQPSPSIGQTVKGYGYGNPQYSPHPNVQPTSHHPPRVQASPHTPMSASSPGQFPVPYQQPQALRGPHRSSFSAQLRSVPPSPIGSATNGNTSQRLPLPREHIQQQTQLSPGAALPLIDGQSTSTLKPPEAKKVRAPTVEPSEEGEVSRQASTAQSSRQGSIDQSVCMESEAEHDVVSEPATPEYEPAEPEPLREPEKPGEFEEDDLEQLDVPDAPKYPGPFDAIGPQPVRFALPTKFEWDCGTLDVLPRPSPGSNGFVQSGYITKKSLVDMEHRFIHLPNYQQDSADPIFLILQGDLKEALAIDEPLIEDAVAEDPNDGTDRSMSCDEDEEKDVEKDEEILVHKATTSPFNEKSSIPQKLPSQHISSQDDYQAPTFTSEMPSNASMSQTDWETEQKLAALGVTGAPKPNRMPARPWQSAELFRQPRHPPPPPEPLPMREDDHQLSPIWHQGSSARHESTSGFHETWETPQQSGTGTPPYVPDLNGDPAEDNPWVPPGGHGLSHNGYSNGHTENGHTPNDVDDQQTPQFPSGRRSSENIGNSQDSTSPTSSRHPLRNSNPAGSPGESHPVWKSNAPIRTSFKDRLAKINSRKREFEPENPSDEDRGKERKRQEDDVTPRLKRRQPKVADAYSRRW